VGGQRQSVPMRAKRTLEIYLSLVFAVVGLSACKKAEPPPPPAPAAPAPAPKPAPPPSPELTAMPAGLPEMPIPPESALSPAKVQLGKMLFFDKRLSGNGAASCETCHQHDKGWTDARALSTKVDGTVNTRHSPTLYNVGFQPHWYWDGRAANLEKQVAAAWKGHMSGDPAKASTALQAIEEYKLRFEDAFGAAGITGDTIAAAIAAFVRTLNSGGSAWDRHEKAEPNAVSEDVIAGYKIFTEKAHCSLCHAPPLFTDHDFHNVGIGSDAKEPDVGRFKVSSDPKHTGAFKTPSLRSVAKSGPYFHDGSVATLEDAVKLMVAGGKKNKFIDEKLKPAKLSKQELAQLLAFIQSLTSEETFEAPRLP
jgi:cytochrome c peroxidase